MFALTKRPYLQRSYGQHPYRGSADHGAIAQLLNLCAEFDQLENYTTVSELDLEMSEPGLDPQRDVRLWQDDQGTLIGFAVVWLPQEVCNPLDGYLWFAVHPDVRNGDLEAAMFAWGETRMDEVGRERNVAVHLRASSRSTLTDRIAALEAYGFEADRHFYTMVRSLLDPIAEPQLPEGFTLRPTLGAAEAEAWVEMFNQSFIDHWNHHPLTVERHLHWLKSPDYNPELDLVAIAPDGTLAGFCYAHIHEDDNRHRNVKDGWINLLGTRRGFRRKGLGRALLLAGLHRLQQQQMVQAKLGVDSENPNQALKLYESVGFQQLYSNLAFLKAVGLS